VTTDALLRADRRSRSSIPILELAAIVAGLRISCAFAPRNVREYQQEIEELDALRR
jgi:hypothetical protein